MMTDYVAQEADELTITKYSRIRMLYRQHGPHSSCYYGGWLYAQAADGSCGFIPNVLHYSLTIAGSLIGCKVEMSMFNDRWADSGMPGVGATQLWCNWGKGGHSVYPEVYSVSAEVGIYYKNGLRCFNPSS